MKGGKFGRKKEEKGIERRKTFSEKLLLGSKFYYISHEKCFQFNGRTVQGPMTEIGNSLFSKL